MAALEANKRRVRRHEITNCSFWARTSTLDLKISLILKLSDQMELNVFLLLAKFCFGIVTR